jgi:methyl-accepting chemotaxis protein
LLKEAAPLTKKLQETFEAQVAYQEKNVKSAYDKAECAFKKNRILMLIVGAAGFLLGLAGAIFLTNNFVTRLNRVSAAMGRVADGDLSTKIRIFAKYEIEDLGHAINRMLESMHNMVTSIKTTAEQVASASTQLYATSEQIATGAEEVAAQAGTVATASEEMSCTSSEIASNCLMAVESSQRASDSASSGFAVVQETVDEMGRIAERVKESARRWKVRRRSDQIGEIVGKSKISRSDQSPGPQCAIEAALPVSRVADSAVVDEVRLRTDHHATRKSVPDHIQMETGGFDAGGGERWKGYHGWARSNRPRKSSSRPTRLPCRSIRLPPPKNRPPPLTRSRTIFNRLPRRS